MPASFGKAESTKNFRKKASAFKKAFFLGVQRRGREKRRYIKGESPRQKGENRFGESAADASKIMRRSEKRIYAGKKSNDLCRNGRIGQ